MHRKGTEGTEKQWQKRNYLPDRDVSEELERKLGAKGMKRYLAGVSDTKRLGSVLQNIENIVW